MKKIFLLTLIFTVIMTSMSAFARNDLIKLGYKPSKELGEALKYAHKLRLSGVTKKEALRQTVTFIENLNK